MTLAIKPIHNLPPHLSYVSTLPDITQNPKHGIDELKQRLINTCNGIPRASSTKPVASTTACMCKGKETSHWTPTLI